MPTVSIAFIGIQKLSVAKKGCVLHWTLYHFNC